MKKQNEKEEIQSRREFFKNAAKGALPILGVALLASNPIVAKAAVTPNGCARYGCGICTNSCKGECKGGCRYTCSGGCKYYACKGVAKN